MEVQWKDLIERAKNDDQDAFSALYEHSYDAVYRTVKSMVKDEDTVMDIVQDAFVSGFSHLDGFRPPENFIPWMRRIATNKARDWFNNKHNKYSIALSQLADEEDNLPEFKDENPDHDPEAVLDRSETTRLIDEILGTLSEEQRIAIGMYYYEEMSVAEIAKALGVSENTIKSRLNYGRQKIKAGVEELEKKGTKLYSLSPVPFFIWLLRCQMAQPATVKAPLWLLEKILAQGGAGAAAGAAAAGTAATGTAAAGSAGGAAAAGAAGATKAGLLSTLGAKITAAVLAVALVSGGIVAAVSFINRGDPAPEPPRTRTETTSDANPSTPADDTGTTTPEATSEKTPETTPETTETTAPETTPGTKQSTPADDTQATTPEDTSEKTPETTSKTTETTAPETGCEALGHTWVEATCTKPRTCSVCGETEGEALGHTVKASYQEAVACSVCGEMVGPLTSDFVTYGIVADMKVGVAYDYDTICYHDPAHKIKGKLTVMFYTVVASDETHEAKDGYEWRIAIFKIECSYDDAEEHGFRFGYNMADYYNSRLMEDSWTGDSDGDGTFLVSYHGQELECYRTIELVGGDVNERQYQISVQVPVGYDGIVYGYRDAAIEWEDGVYIFDRYDPDAFLLFRFN